MKLIIDIPEKVYNEYMDLATGRIPTYKACDIAWVLRKATLLPEGDLISRADAIDACDQSINLLEAVDRIKEL